MTSFAVHRHSLSISPFMKSSENAVLQIVTVFVKAAIIYWVKLVVFNLNDRSFFLFAIHCVFIYFSGKLLLSC